MEDRIRWTLEGDGPACALGAHEQSEREYRSIRFRSAYFLHLGYYCVLFVFFAIGLLDDAFRFVSICLAPLFLALTMARVALHGWEDHTRAQELGSLMTIVCDSTIWAVAMLIFRSTQIKATLLVFVIYIMSIVIYPIVLTMRALSFRQISCLLSVAMATVAGSPSWVEPLSWAEQLGLNGAAFALGGAVASMLAAAQSAAERERSARLYEAHAKLKADSALNHMLKNKFASSQFLLTLALERLEEAEATRGRHANGAAAPATSGANGGARNNANNGVARSTIVVNGTSTSNSNGSSSNNGNTPLASSFEPKEKPKRGPASLVRQVHDLLLQCADWTHKREVFLQLEAGTYQSARPPVDLETLLRRIGGDELDVDCCRSCDASKRVAIDSQMLAVQIEEALANARKYGDLVASRVKLSARVQHRDDIDAIGEMGEDDEIVEIGEDGEISEIGSSLAHSVPLLGSASHAKAQQRTGQLLLHVTLTNQLRTDLQPMSGAECSACFERGARGQAGRASTRSNGIGLSTVRLAAAAAHGRAWISSHLDAKGRDLVTFHCVLPVREIIPAPLLPTASWARKPATAVDERGVAAPSAPSEAALMKAELALLLPPASSPSSSLFPSRSISPAPRLPRPLFCVGVDDDPVMLVLLEATFEQLGAARSRVLGETTAEQLQAVDTILGVAVGATLGASPEGPDSITVAVLDQNLHNQEHLPPLLGTDIAAQLRARGFAGLIVLHTGASAHDVRVLEASPGVDAVIAKGVGKPLPAQLQQLLNTHLSSAALS